MDIREEVAEKCARIRGAAGNGHDAPPGGGSAAAAATAAAAAHRRVPPRRDDDNDQNRQNQDQDHRNDRDDDDDDEAAGAGDENREGQGPSPPPAEEIAGPPREEEQQGHHHHPSSSPSSSPSASDGAGAAAAAVPFDCNFVALRPSLKPAETLLLASSIRGGLIGGTDDPQGIGANGGCMLRSLNLYGSLRDDPDALLPLVVASATPGAAGGNAAFRGSILASHPHLETLNLGWNNLEDKHAAWIATSLLVPTKSPSKDELPSPTPSHLRRLLLGKNRIGDAGARCLAECVSSGRSQPLLEEKEEGEEGEEGGGNTNKAEENSPALPSLVELDLSSNRIGPEGCGAISRALAAGGGKEKKGGGGGGDDNNHGDDGDKGNGYYPPPSSSSPSLLVLKLGNNPIGDAGAEELAVGLGMNGTLAVLWVEDSGIGAAGCMSLAKALRRNVSLCELHLWSNPITSAGADALELSLNHVNTAVEVLPTWFTGVEEDQQCRIDDLCRHNRVTKRRFDRMADAHHQIPPGLWPETLELFRKKPALIYEVLNAKPDLCY